jgi:hypothetical protein
MGNEGKLESVRRQVGQAVDAVGCEIVIFALFPIRDHRRAGFLEARNRVADRFFVKRLKRGIVAIALRKRFDQTEGPRNTANRLGSGWSCEGRISPAENRTTGGSGKPTAVSEF